MHSLQLTILQSIWECAMALQQPSRNGALQKHDLCCASGAAGRDAWHRQLLFQELCFQVSLCHWKPIPFCPRVSSCVCFTDWSEEVIATSSVCLDSQLPHCPVEGQSPAYLSKRDAGVIPAEGWALNSSLRTSGLSCEERPPLGFPEEFAEVAVDTCNDST